MNLPAQNMQTEGVEDFLERLRSSYVEKGYEFCFQPKSKDLPTFLGEYPLDAIARKENENIVIAFTKSNPSGSRPSLVEIRKILEGRPGWKLHVFNKPSGPLDGIAIPPVPSAFIEQRLNDVTRLNDAGEHLAAFLLAWSLLEAAMRSVGLAKNPKPHLPASVVELLTMNGQLDQDLSAKLRALIPLRNRTVHGDLSVGIPTHDQVELLLSATRETLKSSAA